jgi:C-terminal processing protease CtpA/Prc
VAQQHSQRDGDVLLNMALARSQGSTLGFVVYEFNSGVFTVTKVVAGGPASCAGIIPGDVVVGVNRVSTELMSLDLFLEALAKAGESVFLSVVRSSLLVAAAEQQHHLQPQHQHQHQHHYAASPLSQTQPPPQPRSPPSHQQQ